MHVTFTGAGRDALDAALSRAPLHLRPLFLAVRDRGCGLILVAQSRERFTVPAGRPHILLVGDDLAAALGPGGFHARAMRRYLVTCRAAIVVACEPLPSLYGEVCAWAQEKRENVVIIETRPEREAEWLTLLREVAPPDIALALGTVKPAGLPC
ncbi:hypothetical protein MKK50_16210 [Methylobacterium sp. J-043]|nr:hypothetical protein [Methylobacterium sp. J-043]